MFSYMLDFNNDKLRYRKTKHHDIEKRTDGVYYIMNSGRTILPVPIKVDEIIKGGDYVYIYSLKDMKEEEILPQLKEVLKEIYKEKIRVLNEKTRHLEKLKDLILQEELI